MVALNKAVFNKAIEEVKQSFRVIKNIQEPIVAADFDKVKAAVEHHEYCLQFFDGKELSINQQRALDEHKFAFDRALGGKINRLKRAYTEPAKAQTVLIGPRNTVRLQPTVQDTSELNNNIASNSALLLNTSTNDTGQNSTGFLFLQLLLDWRFQIFCAGLLLAGVGGLAIGALGIATLVIPAVATTAFKVATVLGGVGLFAFGVGYYVQPTLQTDLGTTSIPVV